MATVSLGNEEKCISPKKGGDEVVKLKPVKPRCFNAVCVLFTIMEEVGKVIGVQVKY